MNGGSIVQWNIENRIDEIKDLLENETDLSRVFYYSGMLRGLRETLINWPE